MRKGANHVSTSSIGPSNEFSLARGKLNEVLKEYTFARVVEINILPKTDKKHEFFYGRCEIISNSRFDSNKGKKVLFFDKAGRNRQDWLQIGPCKLIDSAWGKEHSSSKVDVGDIIVGIQSTNPRQGTNIDKILKGWSKHGKIIMEASRIVEFGTKLSPNEIIKLVLQKECELAEQAQSFPQSFFHNSLGGYISKDNLKKLAMCKEDFFYMLKVVLWGDMRDLAVLHSIQNKEGMRCKQAPLPNEEKKASAIQISEPALQFITLLSSKLEDPSILGKFYALFDEIFYPPPDPMVEHLFQEYKPEEYLPSSITPKYFPSSPAAGIFSPESPKQSCELPKSPLFFPSSPCSPPSHPALKEPTSPPYIPKSCSPAYPSSPNEPPPDSLTINSRHNSLSLPDHDLDSKVSNVKEKRKKSTTAAKVSKKKKVEN
jgi:hypothetical protein